MKLIRVGYGKKDTPEDMREYKIDGRGPVGTLDEFKKYFPDEEFEIIDSISKENLFETKKTTQLTLKQLEEMEPGKRFAIGTGIYFELHPIEIKWVAVRGKGMPDWCIYYHKVSKDVETIAREGDKMFTESVIKRLVPCNDEAYGRYRT